MNQSYRLVFNHALGMLQVAPEICTSKGKSSKVTRLNRFKKRNISIISTLIISTLPSAVLGATLVITGTTTNNGTIVGDPGDHGYIINSGSTIPELNNQSTASIAGGAGDSGVDGVGAVDGGAGAAGGDGIRNNGVITTLNNNSGR